jgi:predicted ATPase
VPELIGRDEELLLLERFLAGRTGVLLLEGEAGIGKTSVWEAGLERAAAAGYRVLASRAAQAEAQISFAAVADLLGEEADALAALAEPQRRALEVALLLRDSEGRPPELPAIAFALLSALRALAAEAPLLLAIDDAQWLDEPSAAALQFALRRVVAAGCPALVAVRSLPRERAPLELERLPPGALTRLRLAGLRVGGLQRLLRAHLDLAFPRHVLLRIHELSGGNPFYALELARFLHGREDALSGDLPLPRDLHELTRSRLEALPADTRGALAVASALRRPTVALVEAATGVDAAQALRPAADANVAWVEGGDVRFAHPLLARAAYEELGPGAPARHPLAARRARRGP